MRRARRIGAWNPLSRPVMSHVSFYRKWRPKTFEEIIGQERVTRTLQNAIRTNRVVHAYLFAGHRGTGKTTTARILAKALNCVQGPTPTPDNVCPNCEAISGGYSMDVIEIDAASNRGIEEIRELRDRIRLAPTEGRYKVYIIDEAHMLTTEAANALLKTLEEPPAHAILVLVTTEPHRLPATILSRCQRFDFRRVSQKEIVARLKHIAAGEGFAIDDRALALIAGNADGSVRDAESILDQLTAFAAGPITARDVVTVLGVVEEQTALGFADAVITRDVAGCLALVSRVVDEGKDLRQVMRTLIDHFRDLLVVKTGSRDADLIDTTEARLAALATQAEHTTIEDVLRVLNILSGTEGESRWSPQPRLLLEIALIRLCRPEMDPTVEGLRARVQAIEHRLGGAPDPAPPASAPPTPAKPPEVPRRRPTQSRPAGQEDVKAEVTVASGAAVATADAEPAGVPVMVIEDVRRQWGRVLEEVKRTKMFCHALLIEGMPLRLEGSVLVIGLRSGYNFHAENLHRPENRSVVEGAVERIFQRRLRLQCTIYDGPSPAVEPAVTADGDPLVTKAAELFGAQILEVKPLE
ncbi:MAG: DNA polymerase III subunit gamma/tau [Bacillati bacterium ANGP1]|uniref:DNA polymerase III subunit gamma/tau n=1 Tax=Candidatus Segetimicrobium genomatis TaxID=2569760 RepID=A0A537IXG5_9BACT|nr:MAG: DNA polymerase III subunit gamma/tau [Terrabacteria group bacterium ANGP1]